MTNKTIQEALAEVQRKVNEERAKHIEEIVSSINEGNPIGTLLAKYGRKAAASMEKGARASIRKGVKPSTGQNPSTGNDVVVRGNTLPATAGNKTGTAIVPKTEPQVPATISSSSRGLTTTGSQTGTSVAAVSRGNVPVGGGKGSTSRPLEGEIIPPPKASGATPKLPEPKTIDLKVNPPNSNIGRGVAAMAAGGAVAAGVAGLDRTPNSTAAAGVAGLDRTPTTDAKADTSNIDKKINNMVGTPDAPAPLSGFKDNKPPTANPSIGKLLPSTKSTTSKAPSAAPKTTTAAPDIHAKSRAMFQAAQDTKDDSASSFFRADAQRQKELGKKAPSDFSSDEKESGGKKKKMNENLLINAFLKLQETKSSNIFEAAKKAKKDWDKDGKIESEKDEVWGSRMRAAKAAGKMEEEVVRQTSAAPGGRSALDRVKEKLGLGPKEQPSKPSTDSDIPQSDKDALKKKIEKTNEEVEELDELSRKTLGSYVKKASHDVASKSAAVGRYAERANKVRDEIKKGDYENYQQGKKDSDTADKFFKKSWKRREGIAKATDKLAKEEVEELDEISKEKAAKYIDKAASKLGQTGIELGSASYDDTNKVKDLSRKYGNRLIGIGKASGKLSGVARVPAKEEVEFSEEELAHIEAIFNKE